MISPFFLPLNSLSGSPGVNLRWKPEDKEPVAVAHSGQSQDREQGGRRRVTLEGQMKAASHRLDI